MKKIKQKLYYARAYASSLFFDVLVLGVDRKSSWYGLRKQSLETLEVVKSIHRMINAVDALRLLTPAQMIDVVNSTLSPLNEFITLMKNKNG